MVALVIALLLSLGIVAIMASKHKMIRRAATALSYVEKSEITFRRDDYLRTDTDTTYSPIDRD